MLDGWFVLHGFGHLVLHLIWCLKTYYFNFKFPVSCTTAGRGGSPVCISIWERSWDYKQAVVGLENLGKGLLDFQEDGGRGRPRGKMENVTDSQFEMEFI